MSLFEAIGSLSYDILLYKDVKVICFSNVLGSYYQSLAVVCISRFAPHSFTLYRDVAIIVFLSEKMVQPRTNNNRPFVCFTFAEVYVRAYMILSHHVARNKC